MRKIKITIIMVYLAILASVWGAELYVDVGGSQEYRTIQSAIDLFGRLGAAVRRAGG